MSDNLAAAFAATVSAQEKRLNELYAIAADATTRAEAAEAARDEATKLLDWYVGELEQRYVADIRRAANGCQCATLSPKRPEGG